LHSHAFTSTLSNRLVCVESSSSTHLTVDSPQQQAYTTSRRVVLSVLSTACIPLTRPPAATASMPQQIEGMGGRPSPRIQGIGGGFDMLSLDPSYLGSFDVYYPASMVNTQWRVQRVVTSSEGDLGQAAKAWMLMGGSDKLAFTSQLTELYDCSFVTASDNSNDALYQYDGKTVRAAVLDRSSSIASRLKISDNNVHWEKNVPQQTLEYTREKSKDVVKLTVLQRKIEPPAENGFGSDELMKLTSPSGLSGTNIDRVVRVKTRYRRGFDETTGKRLIDGIEIVTTFRVLDGVVGVEMPTSTCKSRIRLTEL